MTDTPAFVRGRGSAPTSTSRFLFITVVLVRFATRSRPIVRHRNGQFSANSGHPDGLKFRVAATPDRDAFTHSPHSITSSAAASSMGGILRLIALAALRLIRNSNLVGW